MRWPTKADFEKTWMRIVCLILTFLCLAFMFVSPAIDYAEGATKRLKIDRQTDISSNAVTKDDGLKWKDGLKSEDDLSKKDLIGIEFKKAIDEITQRLEEQNSWYHYKFILIGGLFALFLGQSGLLTGNILLTSAPPATRVARRNVADVLTSTSNYSILALAVVIALGLDMHIRNNMFGNQTLGLWIANYVEPAYPADATFVPWETFLRKVNAPHIHFDAAYRFGFSVQLHFMTIAAYLVYIIVFQQICITLNKRRSEVQKERQKEILLFGFLLVHLSALAFIFITHAVSSTFRMNLIPFGYYANGWVNFVYFLTPLGGLLFLSTPYLLFLRNKKTNERGSPSPRSDAGPETTKQKSLSIQPS
jgi:hypothetical protein